MDVIGEVVWIRPAKEGEPAGVGFKIPSDRPDDLGKVGKVLEATNAARKSARMDYKILLVEDNPHLMELYEYVMRKLAKSDQLKIEVAIAKDGHDALQRVLNENFDLVVTDLFMPVLDGFALIKKLRENPKTEHIPVVAISAGGADAQEQAKNAGASVYLRKPVRFVDVVETIKALLRL
jgi:CheY-like chemotaxis protein